jgi:hypothetical protein
MSSGVVAGPFPSVSKEVFQRRGARNIKPLEAEGGVVSKRSRSLLICSRSAPYFWFEFTTTPSARLPLSRN